MLDVLGPAVFWLAAAFKARRVADPGQRPVTLALLSFAVALTLDVGPVYLAVDRLIGYPNLTNLLEHAFGLLGVFFLLTFLEQVSGRPTWTRLRTAAVVAVLVVSAVLFFAASPRPEAAEFTRTFGDLALVKAYWMVTIAYFGLCLAALLRLALGHARRAHRREVRVGFTAVGAGVIVGVVYSLLKLAELHFDGNTNNLELLDNVALVAGGTLIGVGFLYPVAVSSVDEFRRTARARLLLVRLRPAWREAIASRPGVVLGRAPSLGADLVGRDPSFRLYRRLIEVQDAALEAGEVLAPSVKALLQDAAMASRANVARTVPS